MLAAAEVQQPRSCSLGNFKFVEENLFARLNHAPARPRHHPPHTHTLLHSTHGTRRNPNCLPLELLGRLYPPLLCSGGNCLPCALRNCSAPTRCPPPPGPPLRLRHGRARLVWPPPQRRSRRPLPHFPREPPVPPPRRGGGRGAARGRRCPRCARQPRHGAENSAACLYSRRA